MRIAFTLLLFAGCGGGTQVARPPAQCEPSAGATDRVTPPATVTAASTTAAPDPASATTPDPVAGMFEDPAGQGQLMFVMPYRSPRSLPADVAELSAEIRIGAAGAPSHRIAPEETWVTPIPADRDIEVSVVPPTGTPATITIRVPRRGLGVVTIGESATPDPPLRAVWSIAPAVERDALHATVHLGSPSGRLGDQICRGSLPELDVVGWREAEHHQLAIVPAPAGRPLTLTVRAQERDAPDCRGRVEATVTLRPPPASRTVVMLMRVDVASYHRTWFTICEWTPDDTFSGCRDVPERTSPRAGE